MNAARQARPALIWSPFPDEPSALEAAKTLLDERLVACVNVFGRIRSVFVWDAGCEEAQEAGALMKTSAALLDRAVARVEALHPYETPVVIGWLADSAPAATRVWIGALEAGDE